MKNPLWWLALLWVLSACASPAPLGANQPTEMSRGLWRGVQVQKTSTAEVRQIYGVPSEVSPQTGAYVYRPNGRQIIVEFSVGVVSALTLNYQEVRVTTQMQIMGDLLQALGKPELVTWSPLEESRTLIWHTQGVAATILVNRLNVDAPQNLIRAVDLFPAQDLAHYKLSAHFRARVPPVNPNLESDGALGKIEDPFKWELWGK